MATLVLTPEEIVEIRRLVDTRATIQTLSDDFIQSDSTLGAATDWAWTLARQKRQDALADTEDFDVFLTGISALELIHFRRAVKARTAGIVSASYREIRKQDAGGIRQDYGGASTQSVLFRDAEREIELLREVAPPGTYAKVIYTLLALG